MSEQTEQSNSRELWVVIGPGLLITLLGFILAFNFVGPPPPKKLRFASGSSWGAYNRFAQQYKDALAHQGLTIEVLETKGSTDNLRLLSEGKADIAFVQGGIKPEDPNIELHALGSVYFEPMWLFVRGDKKPALMSELEGARMAIGPEGSGTRAIALEILEDSGMTDKVTTLPKSGEEAEKMLVAGELDALFLVGPATIPVIGRLLTTEGVELMQFSRANAYERRHQFLSVVPLYAGVIDMEAGVPPNDMEVLAPAATIVVGKDFHRALPAVFLAAARDIHGKGSILSEHGDFPSPLYCSFPVREEAKRFYQYGTSFLYRHLPFYFAAAADRLAILLLPLLGLLFPIIRLLPPVYGWTMKRKIYRKYRALQTLEASIGEAPTGALLAQLTQMQIETQKLASMPSWYAADIYGLRSNLERVRARLDELSSGQSEVAEEDVT